MKTPISPRQPVCGRLAIATVLAAIGLLSRGLAGAPTPPNDEELRKITHAVPSQARKIRCPLRMLLR